MLMRLCEITPEHWTRHLALTREPLHILFRELQGTMTSAENSSSEHQDQIAGDIFGVIGPDLLFKGLQDVYLSNDSNTPSDEWFWQSIFERKRLFTIQKKGGHWYIAPHNKRRYTHRIKVDEIQRTHAQWSQGAMAASIAQNLDIERPEGGTPEVDPTPDVGSLLGDRSISIEAKDAC